MCQELSGIDGRGGKKANFSLLGKFFTSFISHSFLVHNSNLRITTVVTTANQEHLRDLGRCSLFCIYFLLEWGVVGVKFKEQQVVI